MQTTPTRPPIALAPGHRIFSLRLDCQLRAARPALTELVKLWFLRRSDGPVPPRSAFDAQSLKAYLPHIIICEYEPDSRRYRYRLVGTAITDMLGANITGHYFDEIYPAPDLHDLRDICDAVRLSGEPRTASGTMALVDRAVVNMEVLLLPVAVTEGQNPQLLGAVYFSAGDALRKPERETIAAHSAP